MIAFSSTAAKNELHSWHVPQGIISLYEQNREYVFLLKKIDGAIQKIDYSFPGGFSLDERKIKIFCEAACPNLVELSDSSYLLYLHTRGLGGMEAEMQAESEAVRALRVHDLPDDQIAAAVRKNLAKVPGNLYTDINVTAEMHHFMEGNYAMSRCITLRPGWGGGHDNGQVLSLSAIRCTILGIYHENDQYRHIINAYNRGETICLWISNDYTYIELKIEQNTNCVIL